MTLELVMFLVVIVVAPAFAIAMLHVAGWRDAPLLRRLARRTPNPVVALLAMDDLRVEAGLLDASRPRWVRWTSKFAAAVAVLGLTGGFVLAVGAVVEMLGAGKSVQRIESQVTTVGPTRTTEPDGSLDCLTSVSFIGIPEYPTDQMGEPTPRDAAERYAAVEGHSGALIEVEQRRFAIIDQGREIVIIEVSEAPAGGYLGGPIRGCA